VGWDGLGCVVWGGLLGWVGLGCIGLGRDVVLGCVELEWFGVCMDRIG